MFSKNNLFNIVVASTLIMTVLTASHYPELFHQNTMNMNVLNLIARSGNLIARNADCFLACFATYSTETNLIGNKFQTNFKACCTKADNERSQLDKKSLISSQSLANRTEMSCRALGQCKNEKSAETVFECYEIGGTQNAKVWHDMSSDASSFNADYKQEKGNIQANENRCTKKTEIEYKAENMAAYEKFTNCIACHNEEIASSRTSPPTPGPKPTANSEPTTTEPC